MRRATAFMAAFLLLASLAGCGSEPREDNIRNVLQNINTASTQLAEIGKAIQKSVEKSKAEDSKLDLKPALDLLEPLKNLGKKMQEFHSAAELLAPPTAEETQRLRDDNRGALVTAINSLEENRRKLMEQIKSAEERDREVTKEFRSKFGEAEGDYEALSRAS